MIKKLHDKNIKCIFIGYPDNMKENKLYAQIMWKVIVSQDVKFDETKS